MYRIVYTAGFEKAVMRHDRTTRRRLEDALELLEENPFHPHLHIKSLAGPFKGSYSFRLGRDFRVIFILKNGLTIQLLKIAKRGDIYR